VDEDHRISLKELLLAMLVVGLFATCGIILTSKNEKRTAIIHQMEIRDSVPSVAVTVEERPMTTP
jgi:ABC-type proline/glycine betaine transport system permease subunit